MFDASQSTTTIENSILAPLPAEERERIAPSLTPVSLEFESGRQRSKPYRQTPV